jgi:putative phosphoribosyl transferase
MRFHDRTQAGQLLARELAELSGRPDAIVLGVPRGGVVVAYEVAKALDVPLDVHITRKIGAPHNPELAIGAVASDGTTFLDQALIRSMHVSNEYIQAEVERQRQEIGRRLTAYRGARPEPDVEGKTVVLVDDGVATGATVLTSLRALRQRRPAQLILAIPVGAASSLRMLRPEADRIICLHAPEEFWAVGAFYAYFDQTSDKKVIHLLQSLDSTHAQTV